MIKYVKGDVTNPNRTNGIDIIVHIVNDMDQMGSGVAKALYSKWRVVKNTYHRFTKNGLVLGDIQIVPVDSNLVVINMVAQHKVIPIEPIPIRYSAVETCLENITKLEIYENSTIHMPRIGCGLAMGKWENIENIINNVIDKDVIVYDL
jgi:O-acetyl-ADP-ribose deacetylase (regulator of RNase III)